MTSIANVNSVTINTNTFKSSAAANIVSVDLGYVPWANNNMYEAFASKIKLTTITNINNDVTNMYNAFGYCTNLVNTPTLPNSLVNMAFTFYRCFNLVNVPTIPNNVVNMYRAFSDCNNIVHPPVIPNSVVDMGLCFAGCNNLVTAPSIPDSVTIMGQSFVTCKNLTRAPIIPSSVSTMAYAFDGCVNLTGDVYIYSSIITSASAVFNATSLPKNVYIPYNASLGIYTDTYNSFNGAGYNPLTTKDGVTVRENPHFGVYNTDWWACNYDGEIHKYLNATAQTRINIPSQIGGKQSRINLSHFCNKYNSRTTITTIDLNNSMITNMAEMCASCSNLTTVLNVNPNSPVTNMASAFASCAKLTSISAIPNNVTYLYRAFIACSALTTIPNLPKSLVSAGLAFQACNNIVTAPIIHDKIEYMWAMFDSCNKLTGNIYIKSNRVTNAIRCFNGPTTLRKNVYIPFVNSDGTTSATYQAFTVAGYKTDGSYQNVYLMNYAGLY